MHLWKSEDFSYCNPWVTERAIWDGVFSYLITCIENNKLRSYSLIIRECKTSGGSELILKDSEKNLLKEYLAIICEIQPVEFNFLIIKKTTLKKDEVAIFESWMNAKWCEFNKSNILILLYPITFGRVCCSEIGISRTWFSWTSLQVSDVAHGPHVLFVI